MFVAASPSALVGGNRAREFMVKVEHRALGRGLHGCMVGSHGCMVGLTSLGVWDQGRD